jgi:DNA-binding response OmpR family regulator
MKVLVVDDDRTLADVISFAFKREGYQVILAEDGEMALARWAQEKPDLILLDVNMPKMDGYNVCQTIRQKADTPIILLTVRSAEEDVVHGLDLGADDYVTKPFSPGQLVARARAVLRRSTQRLPATFRQKNNIHLDLNRHELTIDGCKPIKLTELEHRLVDCLMINAGQIVTSEIIIDYVWGALGGDMDMLRQLVHRLRNKIEPDPSAPVYIENIPGLGYGFKLRKKG